VRSLRQQVVVILGLALAAPASAQQPLTHVQRDSLRTALASLERELGGIRVPLETVVAGDRVIDAGREVAGDVVVYRGNLEVRGTIAGHAIAMDGDVVLHPGSAVRGSAVALGGEVRADGAAVAGEIRSVAADQPGLAALLRRETEPRRLTGHGASVAAGWFLILIAIGFAVILLRLESLEAVASTIGASFSRAFLVGLLGELLLIPALAAICIGLAITIIGIVVIPLVVVAFIIAACGALALGFLGMAFANGHSLSSRLASSATGGRLGAMRYLLLGMALYLALWLLAALLGWIGMLGPMLKLVAVVVTWLAVTIGFGAVIISRAGTRRPSEAARALEEPIEEDYSWQTPTPVTGVAAARRPTPTRPPVEP
jgi:hypothetical protein